MHIINEEYNKETKESIVVLETPLGRCTGKVKLHPKDTNYESSFYGTTKAYDKAYLKYMQRKIRKAKEEWRTLMNCYNNLLDLHDVNENSIEMYRFEKQVKGKEKQILNLIKEYNLCEEAFKKDNENHIVNIEKVMERINAKRKHRKSN